MSTNRKLLNIVADIYEASYTPEHWPRVLKGIAEITNSDSAMLGYQNNEVAQAGMAHTYNMDPSILPAYAALGEDPHHRLFAEAVPVGTAVTARQIVPERTALERLYSDALKAFMLENDMYYVAGVLLFNDDVRSFGIGLQRGRQSGPWQDKDMAPLTELSPHLQRALHIHKEFTRHRLREQAVQQGLDKLLIGLILLDELLQPLYINPVADSVLKYHPAITLKNHKLCCSQYKDSDALQEAMAKALVAGSQGYSQEGATALGLRHPDRAMPLPLLVAPVGSVGNGLDDNASEARVAVLISDPEQNQPIVPEALSTAYQLTPRESEVAISVANGMSLDEIAAVRGVCATTIKSQLKSVYSKLGVKRQAELVKVLMTGPFRVKF